MNPVKTEDTYVKFQGTQYPMNYEAPLQPALPVPFQGAQYPVNYEAPPEPALPIPPAAPIPPGPPIQPYLRAILVDGTVPGTAVPIAPSYQLQPGVSMILEQSKEYSYLPVEVPKQRGKKPSADQEEQPQLRKRQAPVLAELSSFDQDNTDIGEDVPISPDMTPEEREHAEALNNENARRRMEVLRHRNNISARRGRERRANRAKLLAEARAQALAERNYWKARAYGLGADVLEWFGMPDAEKEDFVADFRVDLETLLGKQPPAGAE